MFTIKNLTTPLVTNLNLQVASGEMVAIIGANGSGKSTLAKVIAGYLKHSSGEISPEYQKIGLLTQNPYLQFIGNTVFDELTYGLEQNNASRREVEAILSTSPLDLTAKLDELSGGQAQQLLIYKELVSSKQVLILDETLSNLDTATKQMMISKLKQSGKAIILITNNLLDTKFADRVMKLENQTLSEQTISNHRVEFQANLNPQLFEYQNYQIKRGFNLITGESNSGKSYLLNNICFDIGIEKKIGLIPQYPFEMITTIDNSHLLTDERAPKLCSRLNLAVDKLEQNIATLSTGELVKSLIVEAIIENKLVIAIDEGLEVLDEQSQVSALELIEEHFEAAIFITHNEQIYDNYPINQLEVKCNR